MCGFNGIYSYQNDNNDMLIVKQMNDAIKFRGPDYQSHMSFHKCNLGHVRLSIIDTSEKSNQPFQSIDNRYTLCFNGEIYNYKELIHDHLKNEKLLTNGDTEVLLKLFIKYDSACLDYLNGMFTFSIFDNKEDRLFIARDRFGIKPLYYTQLNDKFIFSSSIKGILSSELVPRKINNKSLAQYLRLQTVHDPYTLIENINSLGEGQFIDLKNNKFKIKQYYFKRNQRLKVEDKQQIKKKIKELFVQSISLRMRADVPFGAFLSGGIDSSAVVGAMASISTKHKVKTFSITFDDPTYNEGPYAKLVSQKFNTDHTEILLKPNDLLAIIPDAIKYMDHPSGDGINTFLVSKATKAKGIKMALSGLGGDELFGGYALFKRLFKVEKNKWVFKIPLFIRTKISNLLSLFASVSFQKYAELIALESYSINKAHEILRSTYSNKKIKELLNEPFLKKQNALVPIDTHIISSLTHLEHQTYLKHTLLRDSDCMSMAHGLEIRVPFMDHKLIEYVKQVSDNTKFPNTPKQLLVESMAELIPSEIVNRPKMGFTFPWEQWLKKDLRALGEKAIHDLSKRSYFNESSTLGIWEEFLQGRKDLSWSRVWTLIALELWLKENRVE